MKGLLSLGMLSAAICMALPVNAADTVPAAAVADSPTLKAIADRGELRIGTEAGYIPFEMRNKQGRIVGFDVDLARLMARALGVKAVFINTQWDGIIPALLTGKFDVLMSGMTITEERAQQVDFSAPYITIGQTVLINKRLEGKVHSYTDLNDPRYVVVTKLGTTGEIATRKYLSRATIRVFETEADATLEVRNGRADAFVYDLPFNAVYAAQYPDALTYLPEPFTQEPLGWAIRKNDPAFQQWLNAFLAEIRANGRYQALHRKWFSHTAWLSNVTGPDAPAAAPAVPAASAKPPATATQASAPA